MSPRGRSCSSSRSTLSQALWTAHTVLARLFVLPAKDCAVVFIMSPPTLARGELALPWFAGSTGRPS